MSRIPDHIENPSAYAAAIDARIKQNARITRERKFAESYPELLIILNDVWYPEWIEIDGEDQLDLRAITPQERKALLRRLSWLWDGYREYGGLTEAQAAKAQEIIVQVRERQTQYDAEDAARLARAEDWPEDAGRVEHEVQIITAKLKEVPSFNPYDRYSDYVWKIVVEREDGSRAWGTAPSKLLDAVAERTTADRYAEDDVDFARALYGVRLVLRATFEPKHEDAKFAFFKRPHVVSIDEVTLPIQREET